ncbi:protein F [Hepatitis C virus genotype 5]|uniref:protein F n=1 Tax=Hepatitis C virus genotype 5 TaxID=33746 RepID=UPI00083BA52D|nr:protein F [Hepatitis C virus genotype 5]
MSTNPKPQRKPKETPTAAHRTSSSRAVVRSLVEFTCCRAGALNWVCARLGRIRNGRNPVDGASLFPRRADPRAGPGVNPGTLGPFTPMKASGGQGGCSPPEALGLIGAPMTPGGNPPIWVGSSIP